MASHSHSHGPHDPQHGHGQVQAAEVAPLVDPAQESLSQALRAGFVVLAIVMVILLIAYFLSGALVVGPGEQGLIIRLGHLRTNETAESSAPSPHVFGPGAYWSWPDPIERRIRIPGTTQSIEIDTFCFQRPPEALGKPLQQSAPNLEKLTPGVHGAMLSGDRNLSHGVWKVDFRITNAEAYVRAMGEGGRPADMLLRRLTENAVVRTVAGLPVERIIRTSTGEQMDDLTVEVRRRLNEELAALATGIVVDKVSADTVFPGMVREKFLDVTRAQNESEQQINEARQTRAQTLSSAAGPRERYEALLKAIEEYGAAQTAGADAARLASLRGNIDGLLEQAEGEAAARLAEARAKATEAQLRVRREYENFIRYYDAYRKYPQLTAVRLWVAMREATLANLDNEIFFVPLSGEIEIITNRDPIKQIEAEQRRYLQQQGLLPQTGQQ